MNLTHEEMQQARRISRAIQEYLKQTGQKEARTTDIYQFLARKDVIEKDRHEGLHFRKFLHKVKDAGLLKLIPQCSNRLSQNGKNEWYFYLASEQRAELNDIKQNGRKADVIHLPKMKEEEIDLLLEEERPNIERLPKGHKPDLTLQEKQIRENYPRAYEYWSEWEVMIMERFFSSTGNVTKTAALLQRQPHVVREKLEELKIV